MKSCKQLEEEMETLQKELSQLEAAQGRQKTDAAVPGPSPIPSATEKRLASDQNKASGKRQRSSGIWENGRGSTPSTPETFSKKSKKAVVRGIHPAEDTEDTEFELEGLSEVVNKGQSCSAEPSGFRQSSENPPRNLSWSINFLREVRLTAPERA
ncbi:centromere protein F isoform X2 [Callithrix jacchus]